MVTLMKRFTWNNLRGFLLIDNNKKFVRVVQGQNKHNNENQTNSLGR